MVNILHRLLPKEEKFFHMLKEQSSNVVKGANELNNLISNYNKLNDSSRRELVKKIKDIEHEGDVLTHNIIGILDKTFVTPIDKEDIHRLATLLDDIIDLIYATAIRLSIFRIDIIDVHIKNMTDIILEMVRKIDTGILDVSKLKKMDDFYIQIHTLENKGDDVFHNALAKLFDKKDAIEIIRYKNIYEFLENTSDKCEDVANVFESIVVKHA